MINKLIKTERPNLMSTSISTGIGNLPYPHFSYSLLIHYLFSSILKFPNLFSEFQGSLLSIT